MTTNKTLPEWIRAKAPQGAVYEEVRELVERGQLHTVCQSANCPNIGECWRERTATFMILGDTCTRSCRFCAVCKGRPNVPDPDEPRRVAEAAKVLGLKYAVVTSVTRDDLPDGGASVFADTIHRIREICIDCRIEVLIPDFQGDCEALGTVLNATPDTLNHNVETISRLYPVMRPQANYKRSLELLRCAKEMAPTKLTKSGLMVGVGESWEELIETMENIRQASCDILTIGQYLAPSVSHYPVDRYYWPEEFERLKAAGIKMGFAHMESGPLVRSSYHAGKLPF